MSLRVRKFSYLNSAYTDEFFISIMNFAYFTKKTNCSFQEASPWAFCISLKLIFVRNESKYKKLFSILAFHQSTLYSTSKVSRQRMTIYTRRKCKCRYFLLALLCVGGFSIDKLYPDRQCISSSQ